jgi:hypothetical protein
MVVVSLDLQAGFAKRFWELSAKVSIGEKYKVTQSVHRQAHP